MRTMWTAWLAALFLVALAIASGCEDSGATAGKDFTMGVIAIPSNVVLDPGHGIDTADTTIVATVLDASGVPKSGLAVYFSNTGGVLSSGTSPVSTNSEGIAATVLTVGTLDDDEITVTATSGVLSEAVEVGKSTVGVNRNPVAAIVATPTVQQGSNKTVTFDGRTSSDPDAGDFITNYKWTITSTNPDTGRANPLILQGASLSSIAFPSGVNTAFINVQDLTVELLVNDNNGGHGQISAQYRIVAVNCNLNTKPTAVIAGGSPQVLPAGTVGTVRSLTLDGTPSSDAETAIDTYTWNCGNGTDPIPQVPPSKAICNYTIEAAPRTYQATLIVTDRGTGVIDPDTDQYQCAMASTQASIDVTVNPLP